MRKYIFSVLIFLIAAFFNACVTNNSGENQNQVPFKVSTEVYKQTFNEINIVIQDLNLIINNGDYDKWLDYLTDKYKDEMSKPATLLKLSDKPALKKYGLILRNLKDYFIYVVQPSRSAAKLDDLEFIDEDHVKAFTIINSEKIILYYLEKSNGIWKIGFTKI